MKTNFLMLALVATALGYAQKAKVISGDFKNLKGISEYNLVFDYEGLTVDKFDTEEAFLEEKMQKREVKGTAENFRESWFADRERRYEPKFIESFNKRFDKNEVKVQKGLDGAAYTLKVKTRWIYPGYNVGVWRSSSKVNATLYVYANANPSAILLEVAYDNADGKNFGGTDFDSGYRISESYAMLAKVFAADLKKRAK